MKERIQLCVQESGKEIHMVAVDHAPTNGKHYSNGIEAPPVNGSM
jgi:hypothetical protein